MNSLVKLREKQGLTQTKLSALVGVKSNTISQYESGKREPSIIVLKKIAKVLNCTVDDLLKDEN